MPTPRRVGTRSARTSRGTSSARCPNCERLQRENAHLRRSTETQREEIEQLREQVLKAMRRSKRQAAPFSKGDPKKQPTRPGRKPGTQYGPKARRPIPDHVDEIHAVPLPSCCPDCGGAVISEQTLHQYQEEIPTITVTVRRFDIDIGHCVQCHKSVRGRHPLQTSDALGAAGVHVGPSALALGAPVGPSPWALSSTRSSASLSARSRTSFGRSSPSPSAAAA